MSKSATDRSRRRWTPQDEQLCVLLLNEHRPLKEIAAILHRTQQGLNDHLNRSLTKQYAASGHPSYTPQRGESRRGKPRNGTGPSRCDEAEAALRELLIAGPMQTGKLSALMAQRGFGVGTTKKARESLGVLIHKANGKRFMELPASPILTALPSQLTIETQEPGGATLARRVAALEAKLGGIEDGSEVFDRLRDAEEALNHAGSRINSLAERLAHLERELGVKGA